VGITCLVLRIITTAPLPTEGHWVSLFPSHLRIDSLFCGVFVSYWWHFRRTKKQMEFIERRWWTLVFAGSLLCCPAFVWDVLKSGWLPVYGLVMLYLGASSLLLGLLAAPGLSSNRFAKGAAYLGAYSYSVYLWHGVAHDWIAGAVNASWLMQGTVYLLSSWIVGISLSVAIEMPCLRLRNRFLPEAVTRAHSKRPNSRDYASDRGRRLSWSIE
jgi:peptidoglycan/LPS O-acetylase OafA/YrhL